TPTVSRIASLVNTKASSTAPGTIGRPLRTSLIPNHGFLSFAVETATLVWCSLNPPFVLAQLTDCFVVHKLLGQPFTFFKGNREARDRLKSGLVWPSTARLHEM